MGGEGPFLLSLAQLTEAGPFRQWERDWDWGTLSCSPSLLPFKNKSVAKSLSLGVD